MGRISTLPILPSFNHQIITAKMTAKLPPLSAHLAEKAKPWPGYFLVRTTGEVVPLIAIDELPTGTDLEGVPRSLDLEDTIGMLNLGLQRSSGATYQVTKQEEKKEVSPSLVLRTKWVAIVGNQNSKANPFSGH